MPRREQAQSLAAEVVLVDKSPTYSRAAMVSGERAQARRDHAVRAVQPVDGAAMSWTTERRAAIGEICSRVR